MKRTFVYSIKAEKRKQNVSLFNLSWDHICNTTQIAKWGIRVRTLEPGFTPKKNVYVWSQPHNTWEYEDLRVWTGAGRLTCKGKLLIKHETWVLKPESLQEPGRYHRWVKPAGYNKNQAMSWFLFCFSTFDIVQRKSVQLVCKIWCKLEDKW